MPSTASNSECGARALGEGRLLLRLVVCAFLFGQPGEGLRAEAPNRWPTSRLLPTDMFIFGLKMCANF